MTREQWQNRNRTQPININNMTDITAPLTPQRFWQEIAIAVAGSSNAIDSHSMWVWADKALKKNNEQRIDFA